ncbi:hypothetical protein SERLA73DRAFT_147262 [Serpula lacrymans var. lacrymans S7.3]|uniref:SNF2 N-terminal domain-containing protein n=1 Tax=Serpula lacrymans var. lacrymans (strain S7.3) TaxID=936435 RepID=F8QH24_SERL3|nr:hypothetical protein SERLA73DRAFT_147262 [Serpula lacrymans var. lacrymans S7.3]
MAFTRTMSSGGGKTAVFYGLLLLIQELITNPVHGVEDLPTTPVILIVTPLIALGNTQNRRLRWSTCTSRP